MECHVRVLDVAETLVTKWINNPSICIKQTCFEPSWNPLLQCLGMDPIYKLSVLYINIKEWASEGYF